MKGAILYISCVLAALMSSTSLSAADSLENWLPTECQYRGQFTQTRTLQSLPVPLKSSGRFLFDCKAGLIWQTELPIFDTVVYTSANTHFRVTAGGQVKQLKGVVHNGMSAMLQALMGGDKSYLTRSFAVEPDTKPEAGTSDSLVLIPSSRSVKRYLQKIELQKVNEDMDIGLINSETESTLISTSKITAFTLSGIQECQGLFSAESRGCQGLYFPSQLADTLPTDH